MKTLEREAPVASESESLRGYLTFSLGREEYAIDILRVQEIRGYERATQIAGAPEFMKGVINLRGDIVPIVDLRIKFGLSEAVYSALTVVIVLNIRGRLAGIVVDSVSDVLRLASEAVRAAPEFSAGVDTRYIVGLATAGERMVIVVDIEALMCRSDMGLTEDAP